VLLLAVIISRRSAFSVLILLKAFKSLAIVILFAPVLTLLMSLKSAIKSGFIALHIFIRFISLRVVSLILKSYIKNLYS
jgi:hypothetical protein